MTASKASEPTPRAQHIVDKGVISLTPFRLKWPGQAGRAALPLLVGLALCCIVEFTSTITHPFFIGNDFQALPSSTQSSVYIPIPDLHKYVDLFSQSGIGEFLYIKSKLEFLFSFGIHVHRIGDRSFELLSRKNENIFVRVWPFKQHLASYCPEVGGCLPGIFKKTSDKRMYTDISTLTFGNSAGVNNCLDKKYPRAFQPRNCPSCFNGCAPESLGIVGQGKGEPQNSGSEHGDKNVMRIVYQPPQQNDAARNERDKWKGTIFLIGIVLIGVLGDMLNRK